MDARLQTFLPTGSHRLSTNIDQAFEADGSFGKDPKIILTSVVALLSRTENSHSSFGMEDGTVDWQSLLTLREPRPWRVPWVVVWIQPVKPFLCAICNICESLFQCLLFWTNEDPKNSTPIRSLMSLNDHSDEVHADSLCLYEESAAPSFQFRKTKKDFFFWQPDCHYDKSPGET